MLNLPGFEGFYIGSSGLAIAFTHSTYNFEHETIDLITHLTTTSVGFDSVYAVVNRLSKYVYFMPCIATVSADDLD